MNLSKEILSVSELTFAIKKNLEAAFPLVAVKGEISNLKIQSSGHIYFDLKDKEAKLSCALFRLDAAKIKTLPKEGDLVIAKGEINVWAQKGGYSLIVRHLQKEGLGELLLKFQERKEKLQKEGYFDPARKKKIPPFPKTIGVVTSPTGAVIQDILHVLKRRHPGFQLLLNPVSVQGDTAASEIAGAIADFNRYKLADVLIVGRGGGSLEDLWAFNEEIVAKAIFESRIPIISAVGHETDFSISDFVADLRAPTPSAAAELVAEDKIKTLEKLGVIRKRASHHLLQLLREKRGKLTGLLRRPEVSAPSHLFKEKYLRLDQMEEQLHSSITYKLREKRSTLLSLSQKAQLLSPAFKIQEKKQKLHHLEKGLKVAIISRLSYEKNRFFSLKAKESVFQKMQKIVQAKKERLSLLAAHLFSIDPKNLLKQGYALLYTQNKNALILSTKQIQKEDTLSVVLHDGEILATAQEIHPYDRKE